jgi:hypothetical protein
MIASANVSDGTVLACASSKAYKKQSNGMKQCIYVCVCVCVWSMRTRLCSPLSPASLKVMTTSTSSAAVLMSESVAAVAAADGAGMAV